MKHYKVVLGSDHRGLHLKTELIAWLQDGKYCAFIEDIGTKGEDRCNAIDYAVELPKHMTKPDTFGVLICGTGVAMSIVANRFKHIRAALCSDNIVAMLARQHNDANVLILGADIMHEKMAIQTLETFLTTKFLAVDPYTVRCDKLANLGGI